MTAVHVRPDPARIVSYRGCQSPERSVRWTNEVAGNVQRCYERILSVDLVSVAVGVVRNGNRHVCQAVVETLMVDLVGPWLPDLDDDDAADRAEKYEQRSD
ncbi:LOB domain-containing protein [Striga asiatica]|uniref:LOB domain-containing protein n=1 Tax=Striga asiatica TaxID=4170 RepID=A0A5A7PKP0_STRAF|nr:LOB domain-containing protein [Striga asiatica]